MPKRVFWGIIVYTTETQKGEVRLCHDVEVLLHPQQHKQKLRPDRGSISEQTPQISPGTGTERHVVMGMRLGLHTKSRVCCQCRGFILAGTGFFNLVKGKSTEHYECVGS